MTLSLPEAVLNVTLDEYSEGSPLSLQRRRIGDDRTGSLGLLYTVAIRVTAICPRLVILFSLRSRIPITASRRDGSSESHYFNFFVLRQESKGTPRDRVSPAS